LKTPGEKKTAPIADLKLGLDILLFIAGWEYQEIRQI
jgi:hypothetical protein